MNKPANRAKILVATHDQFWSSVEASLKGYDLVFAPSLTDAKRLLGENKFDLFLIGIFFDDSKGVELIKDIRLSVDQTTPIVAARLKDTPNNEMLGQILNALVAAKLADEYIEGVHDTGDMQKKLRKTVESYLPADKVVSLLCLFQISLDNINQHLSSLRLLS